MTRPRAPLLVALLLASLALAGCTSGSGTEQVSNDPGGPFLYTATWDGHNGQKTYTWQTSATRADVTIAAGGTAGSLGFTLKDAAGQPVYQTSADAGSLRAHATSAPGQPGAWTILLTFAGYTGNASLAVRASPTAG
jgi:hypothetical protein